MNLTKLKIQLKHDLQQKIGEYEAKFKFPVVMIDTVITEILSELRTLELEDMAMEGVESGRKESGAKSEERQAC